MSERTLKQSNKKALRPFIREALLISIYYLLENKTVRKVQRTG